MTSKPHKSIKIFPFPKTKEEVWEEWDKLWLPDEEYNEIKNELWANGLVRTASLKKHKPIDGWTLWSIGISGKSPLRKADPNRDDELHVSLAYEHEMDEETKKQLEEEWSNPRRVHLKFNKFTSGGTGELDTQNCDVGSSKIVQDAHNMGWFYRRKIHVSF